MISTYDRNIEVGTANAFRQWLKLLDMNLYFKPLDRDWLIGNGSGYHSSQSRSGVVLTLVHVVGMCGNL
ncbi:hypothetical protein WN73_37895 [Bradyrhizobium sp. CCBAU 45394]|nr:hypothetical protein [Bradyrhizobium sp. CCBAU 45394]